MLFASNRILVSTFFVNIMQSLFELLFKNIRIFLNRSFYKSYKSYVLYLTPLLLQSSAYLFTNQYITSTVYFNPIVCIGVSPPQKHHPLFLAKPPLKSANFPSPPF